MFSEWQATPRLASRCRSEASNLKSQYLSEYRGATSANGTTISALAGELVSAAGAPLTAASRSAIDEYAAAKTQADAATTALADVERRAQELASREDALIASQTRLNVASSALASRDEALKSKEAAHARSEDDLARRFAE